jgi:hypothetical protein
MTAVPRGARLVMDPRGKEMKMKVLVLAGVMALAIAAPAAAEPAAGVSASGDILLTFDTTSPGTMTGHAISGLQPGEKIRGIDVRPATGGLYGVGIVGSTSPDTGRLYTLDPATGAATAVAPGAVPFSAALIDGSSYGFDFNPLSDRIRLVNNDDQNLRLNPNNGSLTMTDATLHHSPAATEQVVAAAYDRNFAGAPATTLFGIDYINDSLVRQGGVDGSPSPNLGELTTIGPLGLVTANKNTDFDIDPSGTAFVAATSNADMIPRLFTISLSTGALTAVGTLGTELGGGFAILPTPAPPAPPPPPPPTMDMPAATPTALAPVVRKCKKKKGRSASAARKRKCGKKK